MRRPLVDRSTISKTSSTKLRLLEAGSRLHYPKSGCAKKRLHRNHEEFPPSNHSVEIVQQLFPWRPCRHCPCEFDICHIANRNRAGVLEKGILSSIRLLIRPTSSATKASVAEKTVTTAWGVIAFIWISPKAMVTYKTNCSTVTVSTDVWVSVSTN